MSLITLAESMPTLWVSLYDGRKFRAAFADAKDAVMTARAFSDGACIHLDAQLREEWLQNDRAHALVDEYPIHPTRAETFLRDLASRADLQWLTLDDGSALYWFRSIELLAVVPEHLRAAVLTLPENWRAA